MSGYNEANCSFKMISVSLLSLCLFLFGCAEGEVNFNDFDATDADVADVYEEVWDSSSEFSENDNQNNSYLDGMISVKIVAAFATVKSIDLYDESGEFKFSMKTNHFFADPGIYYLDIKDEFGNSAFNKDDIMMFVPRVVEGGVLDMTPYYLNGDIPLFKLIVG